MRARSTNKGASAAWPPAGANPAAASPGPVTLPADDLRTLLDVTRALAAPFELHTMLAEVAAAACRVLRAERASVWLVDAGTHLKLEVASDLGDLRIPLGSGLVGLCALERRTVNVPDCYADPRFNREMDRRSGFRTRCVLALPLVDHRDQLVGVLQVLNRREGHFGEADEALGTALAAQCAVALSRVRLTEDAIAAEVLRQEVALASELQRSTLPSEAPQPAGYALSGWFRPASLTGGDTWDAAPVGDRILLLLADATGHGVPAALSVAQMHAMLRLALERGDDLATAYHAVNDRLAATWHDGRFVTAFVGLLDPARHVVQYISGGQGPILHVAPDGRCELRRATLFPMGAMPLREPPRPAELVLAPGERLLLLSDGFFEYEAADGQAFGADGVRQLLAARPEAAAPALIAALVDAVQAHAAGAPQLDDMTALLVHRLR